MEKTENNRSTLTINTKLNIVPMHSSASAVYDSRVDDVRLNTLIISAPTEKGVAMLIHKDMPIEVSYMAAGGRYYFKSKIMSKVTGRNEVYYEIEMPELIEKSEFREFFRISIMQKVNVSKVDGSVRRYFDDAFCVDISGGGLRMISTKNYADMNFVEVDFTTTIQSLGKFTGKVVRIIPTADGKYDIGVKFNNISENDRARIIKYVFKKQIENRQLARR